jgi:tRNA pseudouridine55 synthase
MRETGDVPSIEQIEVVLPDFRGEIQQVPPPHSAIKIQGKKAYEIARSGENVRLEPRDVTITLLEILEYRPPDLVLDIECTAGTYIRSLAHDLGESLSTGAHLANLRRTKAGPFTLEDAIPLPKLEVGFLTDNWERYLLPAAAALPDLPIVQVEDEQLKLIRHGRRIPAETNVSGLARALGPNGELIAILEAVEGSQEWHPRKVFLV